MSLRKRSFTVTLLLVTIVLIVLFIADLPKRPSETDTADSEENVVESTAAEDEEQKAKETVEQPENPATDERTKEQRQRQKAKAKEAAYYADPNTSNQAMQTGWTLIPNTAAPGDVILVRHHQPGSVQWHGKSYPLQSFGTGYYTYLPIPITLDPGSYPIGDRSLTIRSKTFATQKIQVSEEQNSIRRDWEQIEADQEKIDRARSQSADEFLFPAESPFIRPVKGEVTTSFGLTRYVNGEHDGRHQAVDWGAKTGTPVKATNDGVVALAQHLHLTGNSIYIDHGMNLFSQYIHLSELNVEPGDRVEKGDVIGWVGSTGFSTGPHLHFTFWAHNEPVNPNVFFETTPFHWYEHLEEAAADTAS